MSERMKWMGASLAGGMALAGCATQAPPESSEEVVVYAPPPVPGSRTTGFPEDFDFESLGPTAAGPGGSGTPPPESIDFLPFTDIGQTPYAEQLQSGGSEMIGRYTRLRIMNARTSADLVEGGNAGSNAGFRVADDNRAKRNYKDESRGWLERRFGKRKVTRAFIVEFDIDDPDMTSSTALFSSSFESDSTKGETWTTDESLSTFATPYFRVGANSTVNATFKLKMAEEGDADVGANVVGALNTAASLIAPTSTLVTTLTAPQITSASTFLDNSVSNLFGRSIEETTTSALSLRYWRPDPVFMVQLNLSGSNDIKDSENKQVAGEWAVYLDEPVISIFTGARTIFEVDFARLDPGAVLAFRVGEDLTVHDYIFARLDVSARISALNDAAEMGSTSLAREEARQLCNRVSRGLAEIGLNNVDAAIAWWAMAETEQFSMLSMSALRDPELCLATEILEEMGGL